LFYILEGYLLSLFAIVISCEVMPCLSQWRTGAHSLLD
jgi:hypothetical protein